MNMPPVTKNLIIINVLFFLAKLVAKAYGVDLDDLLGLHFFLAPDFQFYQFFTYMFMHGGVAHILFNIASVHGVASAAEKRDYLEKKLKIEELLQAQAEADSH